MKVTFSENNKRYEIQNDHVDEIFENVKRDMDSIFAKYTESSKDALIALISVSCITKALMQWTSNKYGVDDIVETIGAVEIKE